MSPPPSVPAGLALLFRALQDDALVGHFGPADPKNFHAVAAKVRNDSTELRAIIDAACNREFRDKRAHEDTDMLTLAAYWCGVAVAWDAMTALTGGGGAR